MNDLPTLMGVINVTSDSFSDGGEYLDLKKALNQAQKLEDEGATILDLGGEATGPGSKAITIAEEKKRIIPLIKAIRQKSKIKISVDTYKAEVADAALEAGANIINDVTALRGDIDLAAVVAKHKAKLILMYSKDSSARTSIKQKKYQDITSEIKQFLQEKINLAKAAGVDPSQIILDPGMGHFISSIPRYSYEIIVRLNELAQLGHPILLGISRKSLLGGELDQRDLCGLPLTAIAYLNGASIIRTHNVGLTKQFFQFFNGKS